MQNNFKLEIISVYNSKEFVFLLYKIASVYIYVTCYEECYSNFSQYKIALFVQHAPRLIQICKIVTPVAPVVILWPSNEFRI